MAYGRPGVYVTERLLPAPIAPAGTANAAGAVIGEFAQGTESVTLVTSWYDFVKNYGGYDTAFPATFGVGQFFKNGGTELYVRRVLGSGAASAFATISGSPSGTVGTITAKAKGSDGNSLRVQFLAAATEGYYNLTVYKETGIDPTIVDDVVLEQFNNIVITDPNSSDYIVTVLAQESQYITATIPTPATAPAPVQSIIPLTSGANGTAAAKSDFTTAIADFSAVNRPLVIFAPEVINKLGSTVGAEIQDVLIDWADANGGFAVLDTPAGQSVSQAQAYAVSRGATANAAVYYPNIYIADPLGRNAASLRKIGPAGSVAGLYLSTDRQFGPFKAPAGIRQAIGGAVATEKQFTSGELDALNGAAFPVNAIRDVPGAGVVVMGARTLKQDGTPNRYVNSRRSLLYIKRQLEDLTQFALFENNDDRLWARLRTSIAVFLNEYRNQGGLRGTTEAEAFFVKVDAENNPAASIANGEVHIEVGVALEYPAEFIVITLSQKTSN